MAMTNRSWTVSLVLVAVCSQSPLANAGGLRKVWELDLRKAVNATNGSPEFPVFALRFSPDGRRVAVVADVYGTPRERKSRLLVQDVEQPGSQTQQFEVPFGVLENELGRGVALDFGWAPSGEVIYVAGKVINLASRMACDLPDHSVFIRDDVAVSTRSTLSGFSSSKHLTFYNQSCEERDMWNVP
jgi:hypothetical protein